MEKTVEVALKAKRNALSRERRAKDKCQDSMAQLEHKNLLTAELVDKLSCYKGKNLSEHQQGVREQLGDCLHTLVPISRSSITIVDNTLLDLLV